MINSRASIDGWTETDGWTEGDGDREGAPGEGWIESETGQLVKVEERQQVQAISPQSISTVPEQKKDSDGMEPVNWFL